MEMSMAMTTKNPNVKRHKMWMWYHVELEDTVLFKPWTVYDASTMVWTCLVVAIAGVLLEFIKYLRWAADVAHQSVESPPFYGGTSHRPESEMRKRIRRCFSSPHLSQTFLHFLQLSLAYLLMNVYMVFSVYICLSLCLGLAIGKAEEAEGQATKKMKMDDDKGPFMWMWYHVKPQDTILFKSWNVTDSSTMVWACLLVGVAGVLLEAIKYVRWVIQKKQKEKTSISSRYVDRLFSPTHFLQTLLFLIQLGFSYCLMLIFMTFSLWLGIAVVIGLTAGYLIFGFRESQ